MEIHWNQEWMHGFITSVIEYADWGIGPFKSDLAEYCLRLRKTENKFGEYLIVIDYTIIGDNRTDLTARINVSKDASIKQLQAKIEILTSEICDTVNSFKKGWQEQSETYA